MTGRARILECELLNQNVAEVDFNRIVDDIPWPIDELLPLCHPDFSMGNIFVDDDFNITWLWESSALVTTVFIMMSLRSISMRRLWWIKPVWLCR
jgi:hypothetical protein